MAIKDALEQLRALNLSQGQFVVIGSAIMEVYGLREANDVDVWVTEELFDQYLDPDIKQKPKQIQLSEKLELCNLDSSVYGGFEERIARAEIHDGIPFMGLSDLLYWKERKGRPKDLADTELIKNYLGQ